MLNLLDPEAHPSWEGFQATYGDGTSGGTTTEQVKALQVRTHTGLAPRGA